MKTKMLLPTLAMAVCLMAVSCAMTPSASNGPEFIAGRELGEQYAKADAMQFCGFRPADSAAAAIKASKHKRALREQDKSEAFVQGFAWEYHRVFPDYYSLYCGN
jgi:hypothetical protein